jgi:hypothetical protein
MADVAPQQAPRTVGSSQGRTARFLSEPDTATLDRTACSSRFWPERHRSWRDMAARRRAAKSRSKETRNQRSLNCYIHRNTDMTAGASESISTCLTDWSILVIGNSMPPRDP